MPGTVNRLDLIAGPETLEAEHRRGRCGLSRSQERALTALWVCGWSRRRLARQYRVSVGVVAAAIRRHQDVVAEMKRLRAPALRPWGAPGTPR